MGLRSGSSESRREAKMGLRTFGIAVVAALGVLWATSGTQRERALLTGATPDHVRAFEANAAAHPEDAEATRALAQAYLDAAQPGLAVGVLERAPATTRSEPRTRHLYARALLDQGRNDDALAAETTVVASCMPPLEGAGAAAPETGCDALLLGAAVRRAAILRELVSLGVEDTLAHPEASFVAYQNATREARVTVF
jgi:Anaphase-promoting complex, cyclosome, subunit 3